MGYNKVFGIILFGVILLLGESSGQKVCQIGEKVCDGTCYRPGRLQCLAAPGSTYPKLCKMSESLCARNGTHGAFAICYDPEVENCHISDTDEIVCPKGQKVCGSPKYYLECYNPFVQICISDVDAQYPRSILCQFGQKVCGETCYWPLYQQCVRNST